MSALKRNPGALNVLLADNLLLESSFRQIFFAQVFNKNQHCKPRSTDLTKLKATVDEVTQEVRASKVFVPLSNTGTL